MTVGRSLAVQARIVWSVATRDVQIKHRESPLGVLTALVEPLAIIIILTIAFSSIRLRVPGVGDYLMLFLMTGILPISMFRGSAVGAERAFMQMRRSLTLPRLRPLDLMMGGALTNAITLMLLFVAITAFFMLVFTAEPPRNILLALMPLAANALMGLGMGAINLTVRTWFPFWITMFNILIGPIGIMSGLFYTAETLPQNIQDVLYYNPFFHSTELCRTFFFEGFESEFFDPYYYGGSVLTLTFLGLLCERLFRYRLLSLKV